MASVTVSGKELVVSFSAAEVPFVLTRRLGVPLPAVREDKHNSGVGFDQMLVSVPDAAGKVDAINRAREAR